MQDYHTPPRKTNEQFNTSAQAEFTGTPKCEHLEHRIQVENAEVRVTVIPNPNKKADAFKAKVDRLKETLFEISTQFRRVLPSLWHSEPLQKQAARIVDRLTEEESRGKNQAKTLVGINDEVGRLDSNFGDLSMVDRVKAVVNLCENQSNVIRVQHLTENEVSDALASVDKILSEESGVRKKCEGTFAQRIRSLGSALLRAYQANKAWADLKGVTLAESRTTREKLIQLEVQNDDLRRSNEYWIKTAQLRGSKSQSADATSLYVDSVNESHALLTQLGVEQSGDVPARLRSFLGTVRKAIYPVFGCSSVAKLWEVVIKF